VDVLVHEEMLATTQQLATPSVAAGTAHHTSPQQAGKPTVKPRLTVYSHLVLFGNSTDDLMLRRRTTYAGPLEVGEDLMHIDVATSSVVRRVQAAR